MKLSNKVTYALRAALALAQRYRESQLTVAQLAQENSIPKSFLEQILNTLRHQELVRAVRGPKGGYTLARSPHEISVGDIIRAVEGEQEPMICCYPESQSQDCRQQQTCLSQSLCSEMEQHFQRILNGTSLQDILDRRQGSGCAASAGTSCPLISPAPPEL